MDFLTSPEMGQIPKTWTCVYGRLSCCHIQSEHKHNRPATPLCTQNLHNKQYNRWFAVFKLEAQYTSVPHQIWLVHSATGSRCSICKGNSSGPAQDCGQGSEQIITLFPTPLSLLVKTHVLWSPCDLCMTSCNRRSIQGVQQH